MYVHYLENSRNEVNRPISVKSHIDKYLVGSFNDDKLTKIINLHKIKFELLPQIIVNVSSKMNTHKFTNCGERTLFNFFKYPLMTIKIISSIHYEAFFLWKKGAVYRKRENKIIDYSLTTSPVRTLSSQAKAMRRLFTASSTWSVRSMSS